jgi:hypothetical protein
MSLSTSTSDTGYIDLATMTEDERRIARELTEVITFLYRLPHHQVTP